jgi:hypothetical protein
VRLSLFVAPVFRCVIAVVPVVVGCGARTGLDVDVPDASGFAAGGGPHGPGGAFGGGTAPGGGSRGSGGSDEPPPACPACPIDRVCSGPWACIGSDGCTYGWCDRTGFGRAAEMCVPGYASSGWCASAAISFVCANPTESPEGPVFTRCLWPPEGNPGVPGDACRPAPAVTGDQSCGHVRCGPGCTCLCANVCWCGG